VTWNWTFQFSDAAFRPLRSSRPIAAKFSGVRWVGRPFGQNPSIFELCPSLLSTVTFSLSTLISRVVRLQLRDFLLLCVRQNGVLIVFVICGLSFVTTQSQ